MTSMYTAGKKWASTAAVIFVMGACPLAVAAELGAAFDHEKLSLSVETGFEHDDNISVSSLDRTTGKSDNAFFMDLSTSYMLLEEKGRELELTYDFYQTLHEHIEDFDLQIHTLSALSSWEVDAFDVGLDYSFSKILLGRTSLYKYHSLTPSLGFGWSDNQYVRLSYSYQDKDFASTTRDARQHGIGVDNYYFFMEGLSYLSFGLRLEDENTLDSELDYDGVYLRLGLSTPLPVSDLKLQANYEHFWRDYDNVTASISDSRNDEQDLISIDLIKPLRETLSAKLNFEHTNTHSNLASVDAVENRIALSIVAEF